MFRFRAALVVAIGLIPAAAGAQKPREHDLRLPIGGAPGPLNAITDVAGVEVGRSGSPTPAPSGSCATPSSCGRWGNRGCNQWGLPIVAETYDGGLNDINGFHVKAEHVISALDAAKGGAVEEGAIGGGTGMVCHGFKGGIGTASRLLPREQGGYTVGVLVQCNYGLRRDLRIAGVPVGEEIPDLTPCFAGSDITTDDSRFRRRCTDPAGPRDDSGLDADVGSIIVIVATDAPLLPHQLQRIVKRVAVGLARQGGFGGNGSGDIFVAFSTANPGTTMASDSTSVKMISNAIISPLFQATAWATEAAITNALLASETMQGASDLRVYAMPRDRMLSAMRKYARLPQ